MIIEFTLNGAARRIDADPARRAVDYLREEAGLAGVKHGCGQGECGACAILVDGKARLSCLLVLGQLAGRDVVTIEGLGSPDAPHPLQEAFVEHGAVQCGFCTPGMIVAAADLLSHTPRPTREEAREAVAGNLCRCTGYVKIVDAIIAASERSKD